MKAASASGAMMGFMGMGMAQQAGGMNAQNLFAMGQQQAQSQQDHSRFSPAESSWTCTCRTQNSGNFCTNCASQTSSTPSGLAPAEL